MYETVRGKNGDGSALKNFIFENNIQGWNMTQVGSKIEEEWKKRQGTVNLQ
jgi:hypothetical protein